MLFNKLYVNKFYKTLLFLALTTQTFTPLLATAQDEQQQKQTEEHVPYTKTPRSLSVYALSAITLSCVAGIYGLIKLCTYLHQNSTLKKSNNTQAQQNDLKPETTATPQITPQKPTQDLSQDLVTENPALSNPTPAPLPIKPEIIPTTLAPGTPIATTWYDRARDTYSEFIPRVALIDNFINDCQKYADHNKNIPNHTPEDNIVRVATYNVHSWKCVKDQNSFDAIMKVIEAINPDILVLEEVRMNRTYANS